MYPTILGPSALTVNITKKIENSSIFIQWDTVDDSLTTTYTITWTRAGGRLQVATLIEQTSYTITGLTLDTFYSITVSAANKCGSAPEFVTGIILPSSSTTVSPTDASSSSIINPPTDTSSIKISAATVTNTHNTAITIPTSLISPTFNTDSGTIATTSSDVTATTSMNPTIIITTIATTASTTTATSTNTTTTTTGITFSNVTSTATMSPTTTLNIPTTSSFSTASTTVVGPTINTSGSATFSNIVSPTSSANDSSPANTTGESFIVTTRIQRDDYVI